MYQLRDHHPQRGVLLQLKLRHRAKLISHPLHEALLSQRAPQLGQQVDVRILPYAASCNQRNLSEPLPKVATGAPKALQNRPVDILAVET